MIISFDKCSRRWLTSRRVDTRYQSSLHLRSTEVPGFQGVILGVLFGNRIEEEDIRGKVKQTEKEDASKG